ncbi:hypothetical protein EXIGLDRAFT_725414 [Exidia glandulosa HHB12029]|uniref:Uncharacterized protein n=1 Tax=Exidia glandulosa HHB12029 TaxID=1314781 RepID=A0A165E261_EXIGL|nr:hypothetical protein EXIGLDRAFT_725414 [Exidia glandulosa HHB12029]
MHPVDPVPSHAEGIAARDVERGEPDSSNATSNRLVNEMQELPHGDGHETGSAILLELEDAVRDAGLSVDVLLASLRRVNQRVEGAESEVGSALPPIYMHSEPGEVQ